jgi:hypothetical protein
MFEWNGKMVRVYHTRTFSQVSEGCKVVDVFNQIRMLCISPS